ncbi:MAG: hypothetical protein R3190_13210 [Thermoanaerobaculia bacterium]|nr:hypothetical protein [Thermoanaerobaculia bacterium]
MLRLAACHAVLAGDLPAALTGHPNVETAAPGEPHKATSVAAAYALRAVTALPLPPAAAPALYTFSGPSGSTIHLFDKAWKAAADGRLLGPDFPRRSRRIHPFTLLLSLHNQVAATLSLELGLRGPAMNLVDSPAGFVDLLPNLALEATRRDVLVVFSSAANRAEERSRLVHETGCEAGLEGAVALLFRADGGLGSVAQAQSTDGAVRVRAGAAAPGGGRWPFGPGLEPGCGLLLALADGSGHTRIEVGGDSHRRCFEWRAG